MAIRTSCRTKAPRRLYGGVENRIELRLLIAYREAVFMQIERGGCIPKDLPGRSCETR